MEPGPAETHARNATQRALLPCVSGGSGTAARWLTRVASLATSAGSTSNSRLPSHSTPDSSLNSAACAWIRVTVRARVTGGGAQGIAGGGQGALRVPWWGYARRVAEGAAAAREAAECMTRRRRRRRRAPHLLLRVDAHVRERGAHGLELCRVVHALNVLRGQRSSTKTPLARASDEAGGRAGHTSQACLLASAPQRPTTPHSAPQRPTAPRRSGSWPRSPEVRHHWARRLACSAARRAAQRSAAQRSAAHCKEHCQEQGTHGAAARGQELEVVRVVGQLEVLLLLLGGAAHQLVEDVVGALALELVYHPAGERPKASPHRPSGWCAPRCTPVFGARPYEAWAHRCLLAITQQRRQQPQP